MKLGVSLCIHTYFFDFVHVVLLLVLAETL